MFHDTHTIEATSRFPLSSLSVQADLVERHKIETLLICPNAWALRHRFINQQTGETIRARCNRWDCLYCGPRKVDQWQQLVKAAEPTLFLTLSKAGKTVEEAAHALTHVHALPAARFEGQGAKQAWCSTQTCSYFEAHFILAEKKYF